MDSYSNNKTLSSIHFHPYCCVLIHCFFHCHYAPHTRPDISVPTKATQGTLSHALEALLTRYFHISTQSTHKSFFFARYFFCHWRTVSVVPLPAISPNWMLSIFTLFNDSFQHSHSLLQQLHDMSRMSVDPLYLCKPSVTNSYYSPQVSYHPLPQNYNICHPVCSNLISSLEHIHLNTKWFCYYAWLHPNPEIQIQKCRHS